MPNVADQKPKASRINLPTRHAIKSGLDTAHQRLEAFRKLEFRHITLRVRSKFHAAIPSFWRLGLTSRPRDRFPKLIVSTVASGDTSAHVGETDMTLMYSVVDIAGLNAMLENALQNAAGAIIGMTNGSLSTTTLTNEPRKTSVGITMFGVTTPGVDAARRSLEAPGYEVYVFHATGRAMEHLFRERHITAVLDLTTIGLADELVGGVFSAGNNRLAAASQIGALDMVNFGARDTVP